MQTLNIDELVQATSDGVPPIDAKNNPLAPQHSGGLGSFRWLIAGKSGCGKTNTVVSAIMQSFIKFDKLYLVVRDPTQPKYVLLQKFLNTLQNRFAEENGDTTSFYEVITDPTQIPDVDSFDASIVNLVIIDDMLMEKNQSKICEHFIRGRHKSISCIYLTQSYHETLKTIRKQCDYFSIFEPNSKADLVQLAKDHSLSSDFREFKEILSKATETKNSFLFIDRRTDIKILQLRKGFSQVWNPVLHRFENLI